MATESLGGPVLSLKERDRRWSGLRRLMRERGIDAIVVGSFQGRERLESYLIDDFLDSNVVLPLDGEPVLLAFSTGRLSRMLESASRGATPWVGDWRVGFGGAKVAGVLQEKGLAKGRIGIVGDCCRSASGTAWCKGCRGRASRTLRRPTPISCW